MTLLKYIKIL